MGKGGGRHGAGWQGAHMPEWPPSPPAGDRSAAHSGPRNPDPRACSARSLHSTSSGRPQAPGPPTGRAGHPWEPQPFQPGLLTAGDPTPRLKPTAPFCPPPRPQRKTAASGRAPGLFRQRGCPHGSSSEPGSAGLGAERRLQVSRYAHRPAHTHPHALAPHAPYSRAFTRASLASMRICTSALAASSPAAASSACAFSRLALAACGAGGQG